MRLITIKEFNQEYEAYMYKNILENEGIESFVFNDLISTTYPIFNYSTGGIVLKVREQDLERATNILLKNPSN